MSFPSNKKKVTTNVSTAVPNYPIPTRIPRPEHSLSRKSISRNALTVLYQLKNAGYQAYLVGGGVRDVLLDRMPKDFDVVTDAHPEEVKELFHNCRLIGRRFILAHVYFGKDIIEVATFRACHDQSGDGIVEDGRIVRDNVYGSSLDEDAFRRDFTVNALYYDISDFSLISYANGLQDLQKRTLRSIGDPVLRYQEDPVRMLRAIRFAAKLNFVIEPDSAIPIYENGELLSHVNRSRLYEEMLKLFHTGHGANSFEQLQHYDLFHYLFPYTTDCFDDPTTIKLIEQSLANTDQRIQEDKPVTAAFLFASLLWPPLLRVMEKRSYKTMSEQDALFAASQYLVSKQNQHVAIPRKVVILMQDIWWMQLRLTQRKAKNRRSLTLLTHPRFRIGYDFLLLRASAGETVDEWANWWTLLQAVTEDERDNLFNGTKHTRRKKPYRRNRSKRVA